VKAKQANNKQTTKQQNNKPTKQQNNKTTKQQNKKTTKQNEQIYIYIYIYNAVDGGTRPRQLASDYVRSCRFLPHAAITCKGWKDFSSWQ
jgi:hypothetical protein